MKHFQEPKSIYLCQPPPAGYAENKAHLEAGKPDTPQIQNWIDKFAEDRQRRTNQKESAIFLGPASPISHVTIVLKVLVCYAHFAFT